MVVSGYWDGTQWTDEWQGQAGATVRPRSDALVVRLGFAMAVFFPIVGFVIGIVLLARNQVRPGVGVLLTSVLVSYVACGALLDGGEVAPDGGTTIEEEIRREAWLVDEPPKRARVGESIVLERADLKLRLQVTQLADPLAVGPYDEPVGGSDKRFVGVELSAANVGQEGYDLTSADLTLLTASRSRATSADLVEGGDCPSDLSVAVSPVSPGSTRRYCFPFEVEEGVGLSEVQVVLSSDEGGTATGIWSLR